MINRLIAHLRRRNQLIPFLERLTFRKVNEIAEYNENNDHIIIYLQWLELEEGVRKI